MQFVGLLELQISIQLRTFGVRRVCKNGRQFGSIADLKSAIKKESFKLDPGLALTKINSVASRAVGVVDQTDCSTLMN